MSETTPMMAVYRLKTKSTDSDADTIPAIQLSNLFSSQEDPGGMSDAEMDEPVYSMPYRWRVLSRKHKVSSPPVSPTKRQSIILMPDKHDKNKAFMKSVIRRDVLKVTEDLASDPMLYCYTDEQGVSAIEQAVKSGSVDILQVFLKKTTKANKAIFIEHALLYAIQENQLQIVEFLLDERATFWDPVPRKDSKTEDVIILPGKLNQEQNGSTRHKKSKNLDKFKTWADKKQTVSIPGFENSGYSPYITPIILAAKLDRLEIINILLDREASEIHPLTMVCPFVDGECEICIERKVFKSRRDLEDSNRLLEIYRALSSPAYIFLSGVTDPILEAFELSWEMTKMQDEDPSFQFEYGEIALSCRTFAREMLDLCRTTGEVETFLTREESVHQFNTACGSMGFPRIIVAIHFQQKEFIAHPYCQQALEKSWYSGLPDWVCNTELHYCMLMLYVLLWVPLWPIACVLYMLKVIPWVIRHMKHPINKFITDTLSFLTFIALMFVNDVFYGHQGKDLKAGSGFSIVEYLLIVWIIGMSARHLKMLWRHRNTLKNINNLIFTRGVRWFDTIFLLIFWVWIITRLIGIALAHTMWDPEAVRRQWPAGHPILISEAFFAFGTILSFIRLTGLFKASSTLGPLQISLKNMITDIMRFLFIYLVIMTGFVVAITKIYSNYKHNMRIVKGDYREQEDGYIGVSQIKHIPPPKWCILAIVGRSFQQTYITLFWNVFGYGELFENADIVVDYNETNANLVRGNSTEFVEPNIPKHKFTEGVGYFLIGTYHVVAVIVLLNMLIAMMANSFNAIQQNADREWKFARTRLRMTYYSEVGSLPPPFNVAILGSIMKYVVKLCGKCSNTCKGMDGTISGKKQDKEYVYKHLMEKLHKRYWNKKKGEKDYSCIYDNLARLNSSNTNRASET